MSGPTNQGKAEGLEIRQATLTDKQAALDINDNVYDGTDYLKALYEDEFINSANTTSYVAVTNGKIIGFIGACLVDDGRTVVTRAGRIHSEYTGRCFYRTLKQYATSSSKAAINAFTSNTINPAIFSQSFQQRNRHILERKLSRFDFKIEDIHTEGIPETPAMLTQSLLLEYITTEEIKRYLFPHDRIIVNWVPFRLIPSNIPLLWKPKDYSHRVTDVRFENGVVKGLLTFLTTFQVRDNLVCQVDIYGTDIESLHQHMMSHLDFLRLQEEGSILLCMYTEPSVDCDVIARMCEGLGLKKIIWTVSVDPLLVMSAQHLYERSLKCNENAK